MEEFLIILKGDGMNHLSPDELQQVMIDYKSWVSALGEQYITGQRLTAEGALLNSKTDEVFTDGPFLESKEIIAGFFLVKANHLQDAIALAKTSPHLGLYRLEVRPIASPKMT